jgi:Fur family ferric uptake transcriptional regulator
MTASTQTNGPVANVKAARERLRLAGLRLTRPRLALLEALAAQRAPLTVEEIRAAVGTGRCDLVTVYRSMAAFEEIRLVRRHPFPDGRLRFSLNLEEAARFPVICSQTRRIEELEGETASALARALRDAEDRLRALGYTELTHVVQFIGRAPSPVPPLSAPRPQTESADRARPAEGR